MHGLNCALDAAAPSDAVTSSVALRTSDVARSSDAVIERIEHPVLWISTHYLTRF
jgi:hypothetical protein